MSLSQDTRTHVVGELYDTERSYVESLQILVEKYMKPLKSLESNRVLIDSSLVDEIFFTIPEILQHHENFLSALQDRLSSDWDTSQVIGNVFIEAIIDTYTAFINNWKNARHAIKLATQAKPAFERYLEAMSREHRNKLTLDALLIMPVQRIPRYELLIKELLKHTPEQHPDFGLLMEAQKQIHELALKIDRAEKEMMQQEQLKELECLIEGHIELQQPQRDFIRYDLITMLGSSALTTVAKKERVLFLFCDLLIMTSVKKKASRRSNLQSAFANSSNDLSLLEGTKFKLLLRAPLDQVEIRLEQEQFQAQQFEQQQQLQLKQQQQQSRQLEERRRALEDELLILRQLETLASKLSLVQAQKLNDNINELINQLAGHLINLDQVCELEVVNQQQQHESGSQSLLSGAARAQDSNFAQNSTILSGQVNSNEMVGVAIGTTNSSLPEQNLSLELIISNSSSKLSSLSNNNNNNNYTNNNNNNFSSSQLTNGPESLTIEQSQLETQSSELLVVTFGSVERRQAFLHAFIEAKQQRYQLQLQQQRHQQQSQRIYSSSITLRLSQPESPTEQRKLRHQQQQHQLEAESFAQLSIGSSPKKQQPQNEAPPSNQRIISSAPLNQQQQQLLLLQQSTGPYPTTMVHQMSAPQSLAGLPEEVGGVALAFQNAGIHQTACGSCGVNENNQQRQHQHHHHHHQLMHQPASHPASLHTICCRESHNDRHAQQPASEWPAQSSHSVQNASNHYYEQLRRQLKNTTTIATNQQQQQQTEASSEVGVTEGAEEKLVNCGDDQHQMMMMKNITQPTLSSNLSLIFSQPKNGGMNAPKFLLTLPVNFLNTQQPALQFTCSLSRENELLFSGQRRIRRVKRGENNSSQSVLDNSTGQLWLCMSNGYVSHVALISLRRKRLSPEENCCNPIEQHQQQQQLSSPSTNPKRCYRILPVVHSAGDICKSHINCASQIPTKMRRRSSGCYRRRRPRRRRRPTNSQFSESTQATSGGRQVSAARVEQQKSSSSNNNNNNNVEVGVGVGVEVEVAIKSASPPVDIKQMAPSSAKFANNNTQLQQQQQQNSLRLSASAPSQSENIDPNNKSNQLTINSSASTTRIQLPKQEQANNNNNNNNNRSSCLEPQQQQQQQQKHTRNNLVGPDEELGGLVKPIASGRQEPSVAQGKRLRALGAASTNWQSQPQPSRHRHHSPCSISSSSGLMVSGTNRPKPSWHHAHLHHQQHAHNPHHVHHHQHNQQQFNPQASIDLRLLGPHHAHSHSHAHSHPHPHQHHHQPVQGQQQQQHLHHHHLHHHHHHHHHSYSARHNTVPITELRKALERQAKITDITTNNQLGPPTNTPTTSSPIAAELTNQPQQQQLQQLKTNSSNSINSDTKSIKVKRSATPPAGFPKSSTSRSARLLRHPASLKTSSILAKLVSGASRHSAYLRTKSNQLSQDRSQQSDAEDADIDSPTSNQPTAQLNSAELAAATQAAAQVNDEANVRMSPRRFLDANTSDINNNNNSGSLVSPLSSVSSLNSTTSSIGVNSVCASSPNRSTCDLFGHSSSAICCTSGHASLMQHNSGCELGVDNECRLRTRSATVPCRPATVCSRSCSPSGTRGSNNQLLEHQHQVSEYKVSEIIEPTNPSTGGEQLFATSEENNPEGGKTENQDKPEREKGEDDDQEDYNDDDDDDDDDDEAYDDDDDADEDEEELVSLWLGCDDGTLIIIHCLGTESGAGTNLEQENSINNNINCRACDTQNMQNTMRLSTECGNAHSEIKLGASICDISAYKDQLVFVALANGQLAIFSRNNNSTEDSDEDKNNNNTGKPASDYWALSSPRLLNVTENELNGTAKLCLVDEDFLWFSYGRSIFILRISTLKLESTIMVPTNDLALQFSQQSLAIEHLSLMKKLGAVWVSFGNSHLIQLYDVRQPFRLLLELSLAPGVNKMLSNGNEIIRQHKTASLKATAMLTYETEHCTTLFVGTSAGLILYLSLGHSMCFNNSEKLAELDLELSSLCQGHSGQVKLLHLAQLKELHSHQDETGAWLHGEKPAEELFLISAGAGVDFYGQTQTVGAFGSEQEQKTTTTTTNTATNAETNQFGSLLNGDDDNLNHLMIWQL